MYGLESAERLNHIAQRIAFALWQIQELEGVAAQFLVLVDKAEFGMNQEKADVLVKEAQSKTFGTTLRKLISCGHLPPNLQHYFSAFLLERNWLVHNSRSSSRGAIHYQADYETLIIRVEKCIEEALLLSKALLRQAETFLKKKGVSKEELERLTEETLRHWHASKQ